MNRAKKLQLFLEQQREFDWNGNNCAHFAGRWVELLEGANPLQDLPEMSTKAQAYRVIISAGGWEETVTRALNRPPIASVWLHTGDLVLVDVGPGAKALGIVNGRYAACLSTEGAHSKLIAPGSVGWKIGRD